MARAEFINAVSALEGRTDDHIKDYFVLTGAIQRVQHAASRGFAVVGLKGTGKTTLYRSLVEDWEGLEKPFTIGLSTDLASFETYFDKINCLQFERSVRLGMMIFIARKLIENAHQMGVGPHAAAWLNLATREFSPESKFAAAISRHRDLEILGVALSNRSDQSHPFEPFGEDDHQRLRALLDSWNEYRVPLRIVVDDPDRLFTRGTEFDPHLLAGYILGTNAISREFPFVQFVHIVKSSTYDRLWDVEEMANLPIDYFHYISWSKEELKNVIDARLKFSGIDPSEIFEDSVNYSIEILFDRLRNGPRDLLRYLEAILKSNNYLKIGFNSIEALSGQYKREARRQMDSVYGGIYLGIDSFMSEMFGDQATLTVGSFRQKFEVMRLESNPADLDYSQDWLNRSDRSLQTLLDAGVIDAYVDDHWVRPFETEYFKIDIRNRTTMIRLNYVFT